MASPVASRAHRIERLAGLARDEADLGLFLGADLPQAEIVEGFQGPQELMETSTVAQVPKELYSKQDLVDFLRDELAQAEADRSDIIWRMRDWEEIYMAPMGDRKDWPFVGASNLTVPLAQEFVDTQTAALSQTILVPGPVWIMQHFAEEWRDFKHMIEVFMDLLARRELNYETVMENFIREGLKKGTSILELSHEVIPKKYYIYDVTTKQAKSEEREQRAGHVLWNVPIEDFYIPFTETDLQESPWVGKRVWMNAIQLKRRAKAGLFEPDVVGEILNPPAPQGDEKPQGAEDLGDSSLMGEVTEEQRRLLNIRASRQNKHDIRQVWLDWNLDDGDNMESPLQVYYHRTTEKLLSVRFNPYRHGMRPFVSFVPLPIEHQFYGMSYPQRLEAAQKEISTIHNQRRDNATIANIRMFNVRRGSRALRPGDPIFAGRINLINQPDDITSVQLGDVYPSTVQEEGLTRLWAERSIGITDINSRGGQPVTRTTFGAQLALLQEQQKRLDNTIRNLRKASGQLGNMLFGNLIQFGAGDRPMRWLGKRGKILNAIFHLPFEEIEQGVGIQAGAPTSQVNKEVQRQNKLALFNLLTQLYTQLVQMLQTILATQDPILASVMGALVVSAKQYMFDVLETFEETNPEVILSGLTFLEQILPTPEDLGGADRASQNEITTKMLDKLDELRETLRQAVQITPPPAGGNGKAAQPEFRTSEFRRLQTLPESLGGF